MHISPNFHYTFSLSIFHLFFMCWNLINTISFSIFPSATLFIRENHNYFCIFLINRKYELNRYQMDIPMLYVQKISSSMMVISKIKDTFSVVPENTRGDNNDCQCSFCYFSNLFMNCILASDEELALLRTRSHSFFIHHSHSPVRPTFI